METKEQKIRRRFKKVIATSPEFLNLDREKMLNLLCDWFKNNHREIERKELDELIRKCKFGNCEICGKPSEDYSGFCKKCFDNPQVQKALFRLP